MSGAEEQNPLVPETTDERLRELSKLSEELIHLMHRPRSADINWWIALDEVHSKIAQWAPNPQIVNSWWV